MKRAPDVHKLIESHGLRVTRARLRIFELLYQENRHYTPDEMLAVLKERGHAMSAATLYQNLRQLADRGILVKLVGPNGVLRYDANISSHDHIVCSVCNRMVDVATDGPKASLYPRELSAAVSDLSQWQVTGNQIEYRGICPVCRVAQESLK